jgi:hypothetical protein
MAKKSDSQKQLIRHKKLLKKKAKATRKSKSKSNNINDKKYKAFDFDKMFNIGNNDKYYESIKNNFSVRLKPYSKIDTAAIFSSLLLNPDYQSSQYRLEKAISICLSFCLGDKKPDYDVVKFILDKSTELFSMMEDPAEDVFISILWFEDEPYKVSTGLWEGGIYQTQLFLDFIEDAPNNQTNIPIKNKLRAILKISDLIITRLNLHVNEIGAEYQVKTINYAELKKIDDLISQVTISSFSDSKYLPSIDISNVELYKQELGASDLEENPFFVFDNKKSLLLLPSAILACIKRQIITFIRLCYSDELLDSLFFNYQAKKIRQIKLLKKFQDIPIEFYKIRDIDGWGYFEAIIDFDKGYFFHFIFLVENLSAIDNNWFYGLSKPKKDLEQHIEKSIANAKYYAIEKQSGRKGCTILVPCGYGKGFAMGLDFKFDNQWMLASINSHDLETISKDSDCTPHRVWRIIESLEQIHSMGARIVNLNGFLNLYAYAKKHDYCLIPHESFQDSELNPSNVSITIGSNYQVELRQKVLKDLEKLKIYHYKHGWLKVIRGFSDSLFSKNEKYNIYCPEEIDRKLLQCVYVDNDYQLWIEQNIIEKIDFSIQFLFFESALSWIEKIITIIKKFGLTIPNNLNVWHLSFDFSDDFGKIQDCPSSEEILSCFSNEFIEPVLYSKFETKFADGLRQEHNYSEQALILSLLSCICDSNKIINYKELLNEIIENLDSRYIHLFAANNYREFFISEREEPICIERTDDNNIKLNLGWRCRDRSEGNTVEGKTECTNYLGTLVEAIWNILKKKLSSLDREKLIYNLLVNIEKSDRQKERWKRTIKANLALKEDKENLCSVVQEKIMSLNGASLSSRLVIEMAICECPLIGGKEAGILDIQELMGLASSMHHYGGLSESINYDAIQPKLIISTFGDVMFYPDFYDTVLKSYVNKLNESELSSSIENYAEHFIEPTPVGTINHLFEKEFIEAWLDEFGFSFDGVRLFVDTLEDYGFKKNELVYKASYQELLGLFDDDFLDIAKIIIQHLSIYPRNLWQTIPAPFKESDWQPWRFRRRFSLIMRPIVRFDDNNFLISPQHIRNAVIYLGRSCHYAALDENHFSSKLMKKWIGDTRKTNGLAFNTKVASKFQELGWIVREEIKLTEVLNQKLKEDFGDIDVLAWNQKQKVIAVIECKDLEFAKTEGEIARQLYEFKGQLNEKGKKDRLLKHVHRLQVLNENINKLSKFTRIDCDKIVIKGYVVFSNTVPMVFNGNRSYKDEIEFLTFEQLENTA